MTLKFCILLLGLIAPSVFGAQQFVAASSQYYTNRFLVPLVNSSNLTIATRVYLRSTPANMVVLYLGTNDINGNFMRMICSAGSMSFQYSVNGSAPGTGATTLSVNNWYSLAAVITPNGTNVTVRGYVDGVPKGTNNLINGINPMPFVDLAIGARYSAGTFGLTWDGDIDYVSFWDSALDDSEVYSLSSGASPSVVRPDKLRFFVPFGERAIERAQGVVLTKVGNPGPVANSPVSWGRK